MDSKWTDAWNAHGHEELGEDAPWHVHAPDCDWAVSFGLPMTMRHQDNPDVISLMEFRGVVMNMRHEMERQRGETDLAMMEPAAAQFTVIAYNADVILTESLLAVVDQALAANGINPPCQLQQVESSNIRATGFVVPVPESPNGSPAKLEENIDFGTLYVAFHGGKLYRYDDVPLELAERFFEAESKGRFFNEFLKVGEFAYEQIV